jgi:hypothetical protein
MRLYLIFLTLLLTTGTSCKQTGDNNLLVVGEPQVSVKTEPLFPEREVIELVTVCFTAEGKENRLALNKTFFITNTWSFIRKRL